MKLLFVDDERQVLRGLTRMIECWEHDWEIETAESGEEALRILEEDHYDVVVTDMRMPGMDGAELLNEVADRHPDAVRIVLSGQAGKDAVFDAVRPMHQFLAKPCPADHLESTLTRACLLQEMLKQPKLKSLVTRLSSLPSVPSIHSELLSELESPSCSLARIGEIVARDPAMTAKVLQLANSAIAGLSTRVESPAQAVSLLGLNTIRSLVLSGHVLKSSKDKGVDPRMERVMDHSLQVGMMARAIAHRESADERQFNESFTAGLLHDIGKMVLMEDETVDYRAVRQYARQHSVSHRDAEEELLGSTHDAIGAHLLALWGLPQSIIDAVALHHSEIPDDGFSPAAAVAAANLASHATDIPSRDSVLQAALERQGLMERFERWRRYGLLRMSRE